jgi:L-iditol 2-dehydrogenase
MPDTRPDSMRAALLFGKEDLRLVDVPIPPMGRKGVLLRVHACGICPTDLRKYRTLDGGRLELPMNLGHEFVGRVVAAGDQAPGFEVGQRILGQGYVGYAEYAAMDMSLEPNVHARGVITIPHGVSDDAATFTEPLADCLHAVLDQAGLQAGQTLVVIGGGTMGQLLSMVISAYGGRALVAEPLAHRRQAALAFGAAGAIDSSAGDVPAAVRDLNQGRQADGVILTIGVEALVQQALEMVRPRGRVVLFGGFPRPARVEVDPNLIHYQEIILLGSEWVGALPFWNADLFRLALEHIATGRIPVEQLISATYPIAQTARAFAHAGRDDTFKVIITID